MIKAVIFDLDNTLYSYDRAHEKAYAALQRFAKAQLGLTPARFDALHRQASGVLSARCQYGLALHNRLLRYQLMLELEGLSIAAAPQMSLLYWNTLLDNMAPEPGAKQALQALREMGLRIGVGTNMTADWQYAKLERLGFLDLIDFLVTSEEVNAEKPDARLFALCAEKAGAPLPQCAFVGDSLQKDAVAAQNAGMRGIWYNFAAAALELPPAVQMIHALDELPALLRRMNETEGG